jgi:hypothetical protein
VQHMRFERDCGIAQHPHISERIDVVARMRSSPRIEGVGPACRIRVGNKTDLVAAKSELVDKTGDDALNAAIGTGRDRNFRIDGNQDTHLPLPTLVGAQRAILWHEDEACLP